jgi:hypothetical protein
MTRSAFFARESNLPLDAEFPQADVLGLKGFQSRATVVPPDNRTRVAHPMIQRFLLIAAALLLPVSAVCPAEPVEFPAKPVRSFLEAHCVNCHNAAEKKGNLDLEKLATEVQTPANFAAWVKVHDRMRSGEMPPPAKKKRPAKEETDTVVRALDSTLVASDRARRGEQGRALFRRLNRTEYENTLRDLFDLPGLSVRDLLPDDGRAAGFDKTGSALDLSHVQLAKYLEAADVALDMATARYLDKPELYQERIYPGGEYDMLVLMTGGGDAVALKDFKYDDSLFPLIRDKNQSIRDLQVKKLLPYKGSVGVFRTDDCANPGRIQHFVAVHPGRYKLKLSLWSFQWDKGQVKPASQMHAARLTVNGRLVGYFDAPSLKPTEHEVECWFNAGESLKFHAASFWHVRVSETKGRAAEYVGPGIALDWLDIEGPLHDKWPTTGHRRLFGELPLAKITRNEANPPKRERPQQRSRNKVGKFEFATVASTNPLADAEKLLGDFLRRAFRRPVEPEEVQRYVGLVQQRLAAKVCFEDAMRTAYKAALCSPDFVFLKEMSGELDDWAIASRLSYFLWNSLPDDALIKLAQEKKLRQPTVLRQQVERMLNDPKAERLVADFLAHWLDLREIDATCPDRRLYPEFDAYLRDSMVGETRAFFRELLQKNLPASNIVHSEFALLNQKMAEFYEVPGVTGTAFRRVPLPKESHRGGFLTQASVLKLTANGTVTSPVKRGAWVQRKIVGRPPDPPPPDVPAIEPDVRGTTTVREMLNKHRENASCAACHARIDPPGFALESYDVIGGFRDRYRVLGTEGDVPDKARTGGRGVRYRLGPKTDCAGETCDGKAFADIEQFKRILLADPRQLARNFTEQMLIYATGTQVSYADRAEIEKLLDRTAKQGYGVRSTIHEIVQSPLFLSK